MRNRFEMGNEEAAGLNCPLCDSRSNRFYFEDKYRRYFQCDYCDLVFVPELYWLNADEEKAVYDLHENNPEDRGYRQFLSRLCVPMLERLREGAKTKQGLDFGCGPGPTLSLLFEDQGQIMDLYDPCYYDDKSVFDKTYDFICSTEVVEHLHNPKKEFTRLFSMLRSGGWLGLMTKMVLDQHAFSRWHYIQDRTHICFYSRSTFEYIAKNSGAEVSFVAQDVILLQKR